MSDLHPMHPSRMWVDAKDTPREAMYAVVMLSPLMGTFTYAMIRPEHVFRTGLELAGSPEPLAKAVVFGSIIYVIAYMGIGEYLFAGNKEREHE